MNNLRNAVASVRSRTRFVLTGLAVACVSAFLATSSNGATLFWDGGTANIGTNGDGVSQGGAGNWSTAISNWDRGAALSHVAWTNANGDTASFGGSAGTVTLTTGITAGGLTFDVGGYTLQSNTLTLNTGTVITTTSGTTTFASSLALAGAGGVALTKTGAGTLSLATSNTGLGTAAAPAVWTVTGGTFSSGIFSSVLSVTLGNNLGQSPTAATTQLILDAGTLEVRGSGADNANTVGSTRTFQVNAAGGAIRDISGFSNGYNGAITNNAGSSSSLYLSNTAGTSTFAGIISGTGSVTANGVGTVALTNANTFSGGVILNAGTLAINAGSGLGATPGSLTTQLTFAGNSTLQFGAGIGTGAAIGTNRGFLIKNGVTATIDTQTFTVFTNNGISAESGQTGVLNKIGSGTLDLGNNNANDRDNAFLTVLNTAGTLVLNKNSSSSLHAVGGGGLTVAGGIVSLAGSGGDQIYDGAPVAVTGGTFDVAAKNETIGALSGSASGIITNSGATASTLTVGGTLGTGAGTYSGTITNNTAGGGTLALTKAGSGAMVLSGADTYTGTTTVNGGTLTLDNAGTTTARLAGTTGITVNPGGTLSLSSSSGSSTDRINDSATIKLAGGTFNLGGKSEGAAGTNGVGILNLTASSILDFGSSNADGNLIEFSGVSHTLNSNWVLAVTDWNGTSGTGNGNERLLFNGATTDFTSQFAQNEVSFDGVAGYTAVSFGSYYEITALAVPEPSTSAGAGLLLTLVGYRKRRVLGAILKKVAHGS